MEKRKQDENSGTEKRKSFVKKTNKSKSDIAKAVEIAWRNHQPTLLLEEQAVLSIIQDDVCGCGRTDG